MRREQRAPWLRVRPEQVLVPLWIVNSAVPDEIDGCGLAVVGSVLVTSTFNTLLEPAATPPKATGFGWITRPLADAAAAGPRTATDSATAKPMARRGTAQP